MLHVKQHMFTCTLAVRLYTVDTVTKLLVWSETYTLRKKLVKKRLGIRYIQPAVVTVMLTICFSLLLGIENIWLRQA